MREGWSITARHARARGLIARVLILIAGALICGACVRPTDRLSRGDKMSAGTEQQHEQSSNTKDEQSDAAAQTSAPVVYVALGDSTGVGMGARKGGGYVARLFERIERERPRSRVVNLCVSGARTDDVLRGQL